ncbi:S-adenosylmethionine-dependent methyltransferase-like protein [Haloferax mucosum ATCC BAA-1512]|uniref:S-adenosylmethionine-dependent methyltransferase-like protein n=1 Tax=Haloferax mucosum ATCC BAA-1512 TaxID=662479 RepID=M0I768_9EURY|nr:FkbM family methyltransferase [Haloferax mucosum]ELZ91693.1 S-adenosylmethionine-dependent methyltransferase-like protein [Haloferax mucosum ATCC BAA-1512]
MSLLHPVSAVRHAAYSLHYALVRANYNRHLIARKKHVGRAAFKSYELYNRHGNDALLEALLIGLGDEDVVVDVGANTGTYTLAAAATEPTATIVAVEPNPDVVSQLRANVEVNDFGSRVELLDCGLGQSDETREFHLSSYDELGSFSLAHASAWEARVVDTTTVSVRSLDSLVDEGTVPPPDHVKIDVEGFGLNVLRGAETVLREHRPRVYFELHDARGSHDEAAAKSLLRDAGYNLVPVREGWVCEPPAKKEPPQSA